MVNRVSSFFPKGNHSATNIEPKYMNDCKVKRHQNSDTNNRQHRSKQNPPPRSEINFGGGGGGFKLVLRSQTRPHFLK